MTSLFAIRIAHLQDAAGVTALLETSYTKQLKDSYNTEVLAMALPLMTKANPGLLESGTYYVIQAGAELVGCGGWSKKAPGTGELTVGTAHIRHVAAHPDWLRHGIGRSLLSRCFDKAASAGISVLECHSTLVAVEFYLAMGFKVVRPLMMKLAPNTYIDGVFLRRALMPNCR